MDQPNSVISILNQFNSLQTQRKSRFLVICFFAFVAQRPVG